MTQKYLNSFYLLFLYTKKIQKLFICKIEKSKQKSQNKLLISILKTIKRFRFISYNETHELLKRLNIKMINLTFMQSH